MLQLHIFVLGRVQGVFFRNFVKEKADELGIKGWVRNLSDGRVEIVAQSLDQKKLSKLIELCRKGSTSAEVDEVEISYEAIKDRFFDFKITRDSLD